ncbi:MAG TPA: biopolymer transporter ExbD [Tepidisphaeraceae bacterium]|nr:biopolymer transporter ExbD [Tepidisphaeraceae bacterium]
MAKHYGAKNPARFESGPNMTPLVDVVMVILIFLMLVGSFATDQLFLQQKAGLLDVGSTAAKPPEPGEIPDEPIIVRVDPTGGGGFVVRADDIQATTGDVLYPQMKQRFETLTSIGKTSDKITVVIQPNGEIGYGQLIEVYEAILKAGFEKVSFATAK